MNSSKEIIVIGGGPAGMMAGIRAAQLGAKVTLIEKNSMLGRKLLLTGKGRCNLTNACSLDDFLLRFSNKNGLFLRDAFKVMFNQELMKFFEDRGLKLKVERQDRVFPETDLSSSVVAVLKQELARLNVQILYRMSVVSLLQDNASVKGVVLSDGKKLSADKIILATGGLSYQFTGSTGEGLKIAETLGHNIVNPRPGLVPLVTKQSFPKKLSGMALKNVRLKIIAGKKEIMSAIGEVLFTNFGISGPLILSLSGLIDDSIIQNNTTSIEIDLKPALSSQQLNDRFMKDFKLSPKKTISTILKDYLPQRLIEEFLAQVHMDPHKIVNQITQNQRENLIAALKGLKLGIKSCLPMEEAMVTRGGISLKNINPRTMESRLIKNLYFAGEIIDVDGDTGGFNLQAAFSTGYLAGQSAGL